jgi:hypothetical protein
LLKGVPGALQDWDEGSEAMHVDMSPVASAPVQSYEATTLAFGQGERLACLYVVVDGRSDPAVADFLNQWHACCDQTSIDWQAVRRPRSALVGIELLHDCGEVEGRLRLVFDVRRDADALSQLAATEAIVVGTRAYGSFANVMAAYGVDGNAIRAAIKAAQVGLDELVAVAS